MEVAPFFVDFHHFLSIFTILYQFSRFTHFCRDLHFVAIYALFPQIFFGQNSLHRNITRFLHVCERPVGDFLNDNEILHSDVENETREMKQKLSSSHLKRCSPNVKLEKDLQLNDLAEQEEGQFGQ